MLSRGLSQYFDVYTPNMERNINFTYCVGCGPSIPNVKEKMRKTTTGNIVLKNLYKNEN